VNAEPAVEPHVRLGRLNFDGLDAIVHRGLGMGGTARCAKWKRTAKRPSIYRFWRPQG
jgi:hypothetical protein